ncbi:hypothetical protein SH2C18_23210 [Clostridium sediminicola]|uniref:hypothetical protein n=1 Tax=Clostridium sediminicola TaxID=3114879 RepID=UPI0031F2145B
MLIKYEYELLSFIASKGINKLNGDIVINLSRINDDIDEDMDSYFQILDYKTLITLTANKIIINAESWIDFFINNLKKIFTYNNLDVQCEKEIKYKGHNKQFYVELKLNGSSKLFRLVLDKNEIDNKYQEDLIFMCTPNAYEDRLYWLELLNNINLLKMFYSYLKKEITSVNKLIYRNIDIFEGIDEKHVSEIFNVSIKNYFINKSKEIIDFNKKQAEIIYKLICSDNLCYYGIKFNCGDLWIIKNKNKILFLCINDNELVYSDIIDKEINTLHKRVLDKVSEYKELTMFKENNTLDNLMKIISKVTVFFVPTALVVNILSILKLNVMNLKNYKPILIIIIVILTFIQGIIIKLVYIPTIKMSNFKWDI